jgi:glycosyltransferase involved in cell wall biosynthesis
VAFDWGKRKGIDVFTALSKRLPESYKIVLVGTNEQVDKELPKNILSIHRTQNQKELAEIYSAADVFVNPTREEAFGLVNIEALACGTPVITYNTGGSPEVIDSQTGIVVEQGDIEGIVNAIMTIHKNPISSVKCRERAVKYFNKDERFWDYIHLYEELIYVKDE